MAMVDGDRTRQTAADCVLGGDRVAIATLWRWEETQWWPWRGEEAVVAAVQVGRAKRPRRTRRGRCCIGGVAAFGEGRSAWPVTGMRWKRLGAKRWRRWAA